MLADGTLVDAQVQLPGGFGAALHDEMTFFRRALFWVMGESLIRLSIRSVRSIRNVLFCVNVGNGLMHREGVP